MKEIKVYIGCMVLGAAENIVKNAPAFCMFNGIRLEAQSTDDKPEAIVATYHAECEKQAREWRDSPEGKASAAKQEARRVDLQNIADASMAHLASLDFTSCDAVLAWVEQMADPCDHVGVDVSKRTIVTTFKLHGWGVGVNTGDDFKKDDERNFAGYIVGQFLECWHPIVAKFVADWRAEFRGAPKPYDWRAELRSDRVAT